MREELEKELKQKHPIVFARLYNPDTTMQSSCMFWGIETGDGWFDLLDRLCSELEGLNPIPVAEQVKEKYGTLRFYTSGNNSNEEFEIISKYEDESAKTCESCGQNGQLKGSGWLSVRCDLCKS
jgi:hypothetical protein